MAKAYKCDKCDGFVDSASRHDVYFRDGITIDVSYLRATRNKHHELDLCFDCRIDLLKQVIQGIEAKQKYSWEDLKEPQKLGELL